MAVEFSNHANEVRASDGPLERMVPPDEDPTEKSLLTLIEERAVRRASAASTDAGDSRTGRGTVPDRTDETDDQRGLDRTIMRLGGNGF